MSLFIIRRLLQSLSVLFITSLLVFVAVFMIGNPVEMLINPQADQIEVERATHALGLDKPATEQYLVFLKNAFQGDLGKSFVFGRPALEVIVERLPATLELAFLAMTIAVVFGIPLGLWAGMRPRSWAGRSIMAGSILGFSLPTFWVGLLLIMIFAVSLGWLPAGGRGQVGSIFGIHTSLVTWDGLQHALLPAINLALFKLSLIIRLTRASARENLALDYVKFARAKGLSPVRIIGVHVMKNILIPLITVIGLELGSLIAFAIVTESVFAWPGIGKLVIDSIYSLDRPVVIGYMLLTVAMFVVINLVVDVLYSVLDPRVRLGDATA
jgi:peptide/nickel transport system permease protein